MATRYFDFEEYAAGEQICSDGYDNAAIEYEISVEIFKAIRERETETGKLMGSKAKNDFTDMWVAGHFSFVRSVINANFNPCAWLANYLYIRAMEAGEAIREIDTAIAASNAIAEKEVSEDDINRFMENVFDADETNGVYNGLIEYVKAWASTLPTKRG